MAKSYVHFQNLRTFIDVPILLLCATLAEIIFPGNNINAGGIFPYLFFIALIVTWYVAAHISKLYNDLRTNKFSEEIVYIASTLILHAIFLSSILFLLRDSVNLDNYFLLFYFGALFFLVVITKYIIRKYLHYNIYRGKLKERILLIGSTPAALNFIETINNHLFYGYSCIGFLDNDKKILNGCNYLGRIDDLSEIIENHEIDEVIIALPNAAHQEIKYSIETCDHHAKRVRIIPDLYFYASSNIQINTIGLLPVINLRSLPQDRYFNKFLKRTFDILFALGFFIVIGWWLLPLVAILIKLGSAGPVFFKQERWGLNNKRIICYKFRSMQKDSPEFDSSGKFKPASRLDERVTPIGKYLRKYSIDELPQFWNVMIGNMSVVGPRPHPTPLNLSGIKDVENYLLRHLVKPGISGWAQVNGCRGELQNKHDMQTRLNYDLYYIHRWTFGLDCWIILQTIVSLIKGDEKAY